MAKQGISNRQSPQDEARERGEFPPTDPNKREHIERIDEPRGIAEDEEEFDESEEDDEVEDEETPEDD